MGNQSSTDEKLLLQQIQSQLTINQLETQQLKQQLKQQQKQQQHQIRPQPQPNQSQPNIHDILKNPRLQQELRNHPERKRQVLERLLQEFSHLMTSDQVAKIRNIILADSAQNPAMDAPHPSIPSARSSVRPDELMIHAQSQLQSSTNPQELTKHYETSLEREQREFELEQERRKQEFMRQQRERRSVYESKLGELQSEGKTAMQVFQLSANYDMVKLKSAYKKLALKYHPDKPGGDKDKFELITKYYFLLIENLKKTESEGNGYVELKAGATATQGFDKPATAAEMQHAKDNFNLKKFNAMFERYKMYDPNEEGYNDWLKNESSNKTPAPPVFSKKFNLDVFNSTFDNYKQDVSHSSSAALTQYSEPQALVSCHSVGFTEIATFEKTQFDKYQEAKNDLAYSDLKSAYTNGNLIDPNSVNYKQYKNIDELERERSKISFELSPEEQRRLAIQKEKDEQMEHMRRERLAQRDNLIGQTFQKAHQQMLGYAKGGEPPRQLEWHN
jgi:curved DNA-binding protein CbpA